MNDLARYKAVLSGKPAREILSWALETFGEKVAFASSFGAEDQVIADLLLGLDPHAKIFTLDTGRLFQETYDVIQATREKYGAKIDIFFPEAGAVARLVRDDGPNLFYQSVANRKACCAVRKGEPLKRALAGLKAWTVGLRRTQSMTREDVDPIAWDEANGLYKIAPLWDWSEEQVWDYLRTRKVPVNRLHAQGFPSIGCAPCTRAVKPGEDPRSGRWWWERADQRECGLHRK